MELRMEMLRLQNISTCYLIRQKIIWVLGGDEWIAGNLTYHLKDRPKWKLEWHSRDKFPEAIWLCTERTVGSCLYLNDYKINLER